MLDYAEKQLKDIAASYDEELRHRRVPLELSIKIKNFCENLRSALDFLAHETYEWLWPHRTIPKQLAFPMAFEKSKARATINTQFPELRTREPELWQFIEDFQPYHTKSGKWLRHLVRVTNDNKHWDRSAQVVRSAAPGTPEASRLGPVVFQDESTGDWLEPRFNGMYINAFWVLREAETNVRWLVDEVRGFM